MNKKIYSLFLFSFFIIVQFLYAANGSLNVFTGDAQADIYIDGEFIAKEQVLKRPLTEGVHYIQVKKQSVVVRAQSVSIQPDKLETIVVDDFVDYKTNVASRGAIEVEAMRVRETRGNIGIGLYGGSPASGLSLRWWPTGRFGLQAIGLINSFDSNVDSRVGGRLLYNFSESVFQESTLTYYGALGVGRAMLLDRSDVERNETYDLTEAAFGIELKLSSMFDQSPVVSQPRMGNSTTTETIDAGTAIGDLGYMLVMGIGSSFLKLAHLNVEFGLERMFTRYYGADDDVPSRSVLRGKFSGGFHIYF